MKRKNIIKMLIVILIILILLYVLRSTYSKYIEDLFKDAGYTVSPWNITVNNYPLEYNSTVTFPLSGYFWNVPNVTNQKEGIAPNSKYSFDIVVDHTGTATPFEITISWNPTDVPIDDFIPTGYAYTTSNSAKIIKFTDSKLVAVVNPNLNTSVTSNSLGPVFQWVDNGHPKETTDNSKDVEQAKKQTAFVLNVTITVKQITPTTYNTLALQELTPSATFNGIDSYYCEYETTSDDSSNEEP